MRETLAGHGVSTDDFDDDASDGNGGSGSFDRSDAEARLLEDLRATAAAQREEVRAPAISEICRRCDSQLRNL